MTHGHVGPALRVAREAIVDAIGTAYYVAAGIVLVAGLVLLVIELLPLRRLRSRRTDVDPDAICWYAEPGDPPGEDAVLLIGGYQGFANFGDLLQVKGVARWHREVTGLQPVPVLSLTAVADPEFAPRVRAGLGVDQVLYWSEQGHRRGRGRAGRVAPRAARAAPARVRGRVLQRALGRPLRGPDQSAHRRFGVGHYVLSGQQADAAAVPAMRAYFDRRAPSSPAAATLSRPRSCVRPEHRRSTRSTTRSRPWTGSSPRGRRVCRARGRACSSTSTPPLHARRGRGARRRTWVAAAAPTTTSCSCRR